MNCDVVENHETPVRSMFWIVAASLQVDPYLFLVTLCNEFDDDMK